MVLLYMILLPMLEFMHDIPHCLLVVIVTLICQRCEVTSHSTICMHQTLKTSFHPTKTDILSAELCGNDTCPSKQAAFARLMTCLSLCHVLW